MRKACSLKSALALSLLVLLTIVQSATLQGNIDLASSNPSSQVLKIVGSYREVSVNGTDGQQGTELIEDEINQIVRVYSIGDIDNDGIDDIMLKCRGSSIIAYVVYGNATRKESSVEVDHLMQESQGFRILHHGSDRFQDLRSRSGGDFNKDGVSDFIVGYTAAKPIIYVIYGQSDRRISDIDLAEPLNISCGFRIFGCTDDCAVNFAGDINGDGTDDIIIASPHSVRRGRKDVGSVHVIYGSRGGPRADINIAASLERSQGFEITGGKNYKDVERAGDVNGDGIDDIMFKSGIQLPSETSIRDTAIIIYGKLGGHTDIDLRQALDLSQGFQIHGNENECRLEFWAAGDVNGDGVDDILVKRENYMPKYHVVYGKKGGMTTNIYLQQPLDPFIDDFAESILHSIGDVNQDGIDDIIFANFDIWTNMPLHSAWVVYGKAGGTPSAIDLVGENFGRTYGFQITGENIFSSAGSGGDFNGDGFRDIVLAESWYESHYNEIGAAYIVYLGPNFSSESPAISHNIALIIGVCVIGGIFLLVLLLLLCIRNLRRRQLRYNQFDQASPPVSPVGTPVNMSIKEEPTSLMMSMPSPVDKARSPDGLKSSDS